MIGFSDFLNADPTDWLLEEDNPSVRYLTLRSIVEMPEDHRAVQQARREIMERGPVPAILEAQHPEGYWLKPGVGYSPKYKATIWQIKFLAQLAADGSDERVARGCEYVLSHSRARNGAFSVTGVPSAAVDCLNGNLVHAFVTLGYGRDERVQEAVRALCKSISEKHFQCAANAKLPCGWGAVKALLAFTAIPPEERTAEVKSAIQEGADFLLSRNPAVADYPCWERVSSTWRKFGFPLGYSSNVLEALWVLAELGHGNSPALGDALKLVLSKQDAHGRWKMENSLNGKMWADIEAKGKPSKWVTLQAMQMLKRVYGGY